MRGLEPGGEFAHVVGVFYFGDAVPYSAGAHALDDLAVDLGGSGGAF